MAAGLALSMSAKIRLGPGICIFFCPKLAQAVGKSYSSQSRPKIFLSRLKYDIGEIMCTLLISRSTRLVKSSQVLLDISKYSV